MERGDIFCVKKDSLFAKAILWVQARSSRDGKAQYSHTGIIVDEDGSTLEALSTIRFENVFENCSGYQVIIGRNREMTDEAFHCGLEAVQDQIGKWYPWWRLFAHLIPSVAIHSNVSKRLTCAALGCKFLWGGKLLGYYEGMNPDKVADMMIEFKNWDIIYEGRLP